MANGTPPKSASIDVATGRARLLSDRFQPAPEGQNIAGSYGELWFNRYGAPVLISYFGSDVTRFSQESLDNALACRDEKLR